MRVVLAALSLLVAAIPASAAETVPGEVVVGFAAAADRQAARGAVGARLDRRLADPSVQVLRVPAGTSVRAAARTLERRPGVSFAEPNFVSRVAAAPGDPFFAQQWSLARIDAPAAWDLQTGSPAVRVAVLDTGMDLDHQDLAPNLWQNPGDPTADGVDDDANGLVDDVHGWDVVGADPTPEDEAVTGHGTHVAGLVGARADNGLGIAGVAWRTGLIPLRVCDAEGACTTAAQASAIALARGYGARVVNLSIAGSDRSDAVEQQIEASPDTLFVAAAGNTSASNDAPGTPVFPCNLPAANVLCVAATDEDDTPAAESNFGAINVDLAAPGGVNGAGQGQISTYLGGTYFRKTGTSFAAPLVSGAAALLWSQMPDETVAGVRGALLDGAERVPALTNLVATGARLDLPGALTALATTPPRAAIDAGPPARTRDTGATFALRSDRRATFECRLDGGAFAACASPFAVRDLTSGGHALDVRAVGPAGLVGPVVTRAWTIDREGPDASFVLPPPETTDQSDVTFAFVAGESGATFECRLDDEAFSACAPPVRRTLAEGAHAFAVRALDDLGNPGPVATRAVTYAPPGLAVTPEPAPTAAPGGPVTPRSPAALARATVRRFAGLKRRAAARLRPFTLTYTATTGGYVSIEVRLGTRRVAGGRVETYRAGDVGRLRVRVTKAGARALRRARGRKVRVTASVRPYLGDARAVSRTARLAR